MKLIAVVVAGAVAAASSGPSRSEPTATPNYAEALQSADRFLHAWLQRDVDQGLPLVSRRLIAEVQQDSTKSEDWLWMYLTGLSNPHHMAFEIGAGTAVDSVRFSFPVVLFELYTGEDSSVRVEDSMGVVREGGLWRIDRLPRTEARKQGLPEPHGGR